MMHHFPGNLRRPIIPPCRASYGEAEILKRIRQLRSEGMGFDRIAERLNA